MPVEINIYKGVR